MGELQLFNENDLLNGNNLEEQRQLFYKNIEKLKIEEKDLKREIGCGLTILDWFNFLYDLQDGYSAMFYLNINKEVGQRMYLTTESAKAVVISEFIHCYSSMNTFFYPKRQKKALRKIGFFYIDVDPRMVKISKEECLSKIYEKIEKKIIPKPSSIVDSGGGYYVIYKIEPVFAKSEKIQKLFGHIESFLVDMLLDIGGDKNAKDLARVLRVPGTINGKYSANTFVKVIEFNENLIYSFKDFVDTMNKKNNFDLDEWRKIKEKQKAKQELTVTEKTAEKSILKTWKKAVAKRFSERSLMSNRSIDFKRLVMMRSRNMKGYRNTVLWLYGNCQRNLVLSKEELNLKLRELNQMFNEPLKIKEIEEMTTHCWEDKIYKIRNSTIIKKLNITKEEQKTLVTIIDKEEKYDRKNKKRRSKRRNDNGLTQREQAKIDLSNEIQQLKSEGFTQKEVAEKVKKSLRTVKGYWN